MKHVNDRKPNFYDDDGRLYLRRCFACVPEGGRENYALAVAAGECAWCGWTRENATALEATDAHP